MDFASSVQVVRSHSFPSWASRWGHAQMTFWFQSWVSQSRGLGYYVPDFWIKETIRNCGNHVHIVSTAELGSLFVMSEEKWIPPLSDSFKCFVWGPLSLLQTGSQGALCILKMCVNLVYFALCFKNKTNGISCQHINWEDCMPESSFSWEVSPKIPGLTFLHYSDRLGWWQLPPGGSPGQASTVPAIHQGLRSRQPTHSLVGIWIFDLLGRDFVTIHQWLILELTTGILKTLWVGQSTSSTKSVNAETTCFP